MTSGSMPAMLPAYLFNMRVQVTTTVPQPEQCHTCTGHVKLLFVNKHNRLGNAYRPFYKCTEKDCQQFISFADDRGCNNVWAPDCECYGGHKARLQVTNGWYGLYYKCAQGKCRYFAWCTDEEGRRQRLPSIGAVVSWIQWGYI